ncbi:MAG TPA: SDR family oxidoreductase [Brevefilum fermentans]|jgi:dihydroflavonol-4-reductase|uniref:NAD-dependent epimerase/dehydratase family protein n=1 Tax=Candidatus Brevifilum fermentans TaxID=1986204 RepID=A0A1Y6K4C2_9CHLR|nr:SDR family oxidoreductase [Brevefilum fermentans]MDI9565270.1 SDR family oxidoreductase [Chloroflexota bacterium]OQB84485.1 MAG: 3 beta-hydroxysteroid dehydrogenase/Delta 5-->4-isomerase [Chloroflexi bacterium ADurb.Bin120]SMX53718.1 NAD-dependent epimerase/dehydratase family protein [Brevefilum fermentans]HPX96275.1 SDR family oxidoreductase [Brevefilum fermentans]HQA29281.1 SDR family oxidoreductase [Brevefilum fermentans]
MNLITGAAGHIGNVLVRELLSRGEKVRALILPGEDTRSLDGLPVERVEGNVLDLDSLRAAMQDVDVVFHLASLVSITKDQEELVRKVNVDGTRNVIEAVRDARVRRLVYTSSIHALERPPIGTPVNEALKFDPENAAGVYDQTKAEASLLVKQAASEGLDAVILCPTGVTGPYDFRRSEVGELILSFMQKRITFLVEGAYDFVDVRDVATGQILARDYAKSGETYILGGERIELKLMHDLVKKVTGKDTKVLSFPLPVALIVAPIAELYYKVTKTRPRFTRYSIETVISNSEIYSDKAKAELGYKPRSLVNSIADTVRWWWENLGLTRKSLRL